jgi:ribosomal protein S18 acetylase RimI-like enzyme
MKKIGIAIVRFISAIKRPSKKRAAHLMRQRGETSESYTIREAVADDIPKLSALHVKAWAETYWAVKKPPTYEIREYQWKELFKVIDGNWFCLVVEDSNSNLVGFAKGVRYNHSDLPGYAGELNKIYLLQTHQRIGLGKRLLCAVASRFISMGITNMVLFGVAENPSIYFHEAMGGERLYAENGEFHGGFAWKDLHKLAEACPE